MKSGRMLPGEPAPELGDEVPYEGGALGRQRKSTTFRGARKILTTFGASGGDMYALKLTRAGWRYVFSGRRTISRYFAEIDTPASP